MSDKKDDKKDDKKIDFHNRLQSLFDENLDKKASLSPGTTINVKAANQTELAHAIEISRQSISRYMTERTQPSLDVAITIAKYYEISLDYLVGLSDYKSLSKDIKQACIYTGLSEQAAKTLSLTKADSVHPLQIKIISRLIENGTLIKIARLLERSLVNESQYNFLYGESDETGIRADMLETDEHQFSKIVTALYSEIINDLGKRFQDEIEKLSSSRIETILEQAEITIDKMQAILNAVDESTWKAHQARKVQKMIEANASKT